MDEFVTGFMSNRQPAWHGKGTVFDGYPGRDEAMEAAGHNFNVEEVPLYIHDFNPETEDVAPYAVSGWKALRREDTQEVLNICQQSYHVVQNDVMWDIVDALLAEQKEVRYETGGILKGGAILWVLARIDEPEVVFGDNCPTFPYFMVHTSHNRETSTVASGTSIRVVCWNTFSFSINQSEKSGYKYTFHHTKNVMDRIEEAKEALTTVRQVHREYMELANVLATVKVTKAQINEFIATIIPEPRMDEISDRVRKNIDDARFSLYEVLQGETIPDEHKHTAYGLFQSAIEYHDHIRAYKSEESYLKRNILPADAFKTKIAHTVLEVAK
jgi:phage/plasmid-like protein (TIGR03299 family)